MNWIQKDGNTRSRLNIVHLATTIERGGAENQLLILCKQQISQGHNVGVYYLKGNPELQSDFEKIGALVSTRLTHKSFLVQLILMRFTRMNRDTIFHAHLPQAEILLKFGLSRRKLKCISRHFGGQFYPKIPNVFSVLLSRIITWNIPLVIAPSKFTSEYLHNSKELSKKKKIELVTYGFSKEDFLNQKCHDKNNQEDLQSRVNIGTVGRLSIEKDYPTILKAFAKVLSVRCDVNLKIVGVGPLDRKSVV
jgi:glycosyltransferase involved in cell wall biosynthesis